MKKYIKLEKFFLLMSIFYYQRANGYIEKIIKIEGIEYAIKVFKFSFRDRGINAFQLFGT